MLLTIISFLLSLIVCFLIADFLSGLGHWFEDTWTVPGKSSFLDKSIILPNIDHHRRPGGMNPNAYWTTNRVTIVLTAIVGVILLLCHVSAWQPYFILFLAAHSNQIHAWAHTRKVPKIIGWLQKYGILQSVSHHGLHHKRPYESRYCTTTNFLNPFLDGIGFWRGLEALAVKCGATVERGSEARSGF